MRLISGTLYALHRSLGYQFSPTSNHQPSEEKLPRTGWWWRSSHMIVGQFTMIFLTHHNNVWHPESLYGVLTPIDIKSQWRESWKSARVVNAHLVDDHTIRQQHDNSGLLNRFRTGQGHCGACRKSYIQTLICAPVVRPKRCPTSLNPALNLRSWTVVCPSFTQLMMLLLPVADNGLNRIRKKNYKIWRICLLKWWFCYKTKVLIFSLQQCTEFKCTRNRFAAGTAGDLQRGAASRKGKRERERGKHGGEMDGNSWWERS